MSECVVRMEMPKSCPCELAGGYDIPLPCFAGHGIPKRCKEFDECVENGRKPDWCPFVCALPEGHGRLVDGDNLMAEMKNRKWMIGRASDPDCLVFDAPTIVPAEGESPLPKPTDPLPIRGVEYVPTEVNVKTGIVTYELRERSET